MKETSTEPGRIGRAAANLFPGYFALVMATGIISVAAHLSGMGLPARALLAVNLVAYPVLWALLLIRLIRFFPRVRADITDHARGPGFFTTVAGTCVLGSQLVIVAGRTEAAGVLWLVGLMLWVLVMYTFFTAVTVREDKPPLETGLNGAWLIAAVATQSVSVLGTLLSGHFAPYREPLLFFTLCMFLTGCMLYLLLIVLIFYRFTFLSLTSAALTPPYWINMGAVAITTLAGARLILAAPESRLLAEILPFIKGFARARGERTEEGFEVKRTLTNQQIAARVGSVREVVSRALARLQQDGLVTLEGRRLSIPDEAALASYAGED